MDGALSVSEAAPGSLSELSGLQGAEGLALTLTAQGTWPRPRLRLEGRVRHLEPPAMTVGDLRVEATAVPGDDAGRWSFAARSDAASLSSTVAGTGPLLRGPAGLSLAGSFDGGNALNPFCRRSHEFLRHDGTQAG